ncbi:hypothetical protein ATANTOWER_014851 [Ataeniobius toweri]|uniref:Uncharacterized protein n=1 Tax=Ataeniobius toweri TaxID=208326 RepID=A0ABU7A6G5_9TELE|nr:hypothetical protein [Ataeniobius toweri]
MPPSPNTHQHHTLRDSVTNSFCWLIIPNFLPTLFYMRNTQPNNAWSLLFALTGALSSSVFVKVSRRSAPFPLLLNFGFLRSSLETGEENASPSYRIEEV